MKNEINLRVKQLREYMLQHHLAAFIIPSTDPHAGEYVPTHWEARKWLSGFSGSAGTAVVTLNDAALWTDSRYFLSAVEELENTPFVLMKEKLPETPSIAQWLANNLDSETIVGIDGWVSSAASVETLRNELACYELTLETALDPIHEIWKDRPTRPTDPITLHSIEYAGVTSQEKIATIRQQLAAQHADGMIISALDELAWTLNLRGNDVKNTPLFIGYLLLTQHEATLCVDAEKLTPEVLDYLAQQQIKIASYDTILNVIEETMAKTFLLDPNYTNHAIFSTTRKYYDIIPSQSPIAMLKAVKNEIEIEGYRKAMLNDGVALVKFLKWLKPAVNAGNQTEYTISNKIAALRAQHPDNRGVSFDTIAGYAKHGAIVHYTPTATSSATLKPEGLLLLDSGGQYVYGTTDITRTIALGPTTERERRDYTLVLKGFIMLNRTKFPEGISGTQLDICARYAMWQEGINYLHGTGHGVGAYLNVHEGPHQFRMNYVPAPFLPHMTVTNEPGLYRANQHGIRIENLLLTIPYMESDFGRFLQFEQLSLCPIDTTPIDLSIMTEIEIDWLNEYHQIVYDRLAPLLEEEERNWLKEATTPITLIN